MLIPVVSFYLSKPQEKRHDRRLIGKSTQQRQSFVIHRAAKTKRETEIRLGSGHPPPTHGTVRHELPPLLAGGSWFKHTYTASLMAFQTQRALPGNASKQDEQTSGLCLTPSHIHKVMTTAGLTVVSSVVLDTNESNTEILPDEQ